MEKYNTRKRPISERFWEKVIVAGPDDCWLWTASTYRNGYGQIGIANQKITSAHRISYELHNGPIPDNLLVLHKCDNHRCVNPVHLFLGTQQDNIDDMHKKGRNRQPKNEKHRDAKFTNQQVREIRAMYATGNYGQSELARMFGVTKTCMRELVLKHNYRDV